MPWKRARVWFLRIAPGCWNFRLVLDYEQCCWCAGDKLFADITYPKLWAARWAEQADR